LGFAPGRINSMIMLQLRDMHISRRCEQYRRTVYKAKPFKPVSHFLLPSAITIGLRKVNER
jgi:hypothetical protein